ncbi:MAG: hypothetical protein BMS9Abin11_0372 [Gammaproteobacteria bacterium]|nr:MAG: hypothetical protein BMS9Abin11_0372 [Gammaproteobacteria bacterium]
MSAGRLIPLILLLLLLGAAAYIYLQGGTEFVIATIDRILGKDQKPLIDTRPGGDGKTRLGIDIPNKPLHGKLSDQKFTMQQATIENGILTLRQGKDFFPDRSVTIFLFTEKWEIPFNKTYTVKSGGVSIGTIPHVHLKYKVKGKNIPGTEIFVRDYTMTLVFSGEKNNRIIGKIYLKLPSKKHSEIAGTFRAEIKGFRLKADGTPDLARDNFENLRYLALLGVMKQDPNQDIKDIKYYDVRYDSSSSRNPKKTLTGSLDIEYKVGESAVQGKRYQFVKQGEWRLLRALGLNQVAEAHPFKEPDEKSSVYAQLRFLTAEALEQHAVHNHKGKGLYGFRFNHVTNPDNTVAVSTAKYALERGSKSLHEVRFFFRYTKQGWVLRRTLTPDEKFDRKTGKVIANKLK